jgi:hypothetical protein
MLLIFSSFHLVNAQWHRVITIEKKGIVMKKKKETQNKEDKKVQDTPKKKTRRVTAATLDAIINSPVQAVRSHLHRGDWSHTGTNISYEGTTAPGSGGSVGTGEASGQDAVGARISTRDESDFASHKHKMSKDGPLESEDDEKKEKHKKDR